MEDSTSNQNQVIGLNMNFTAVKKPWQGFFLDLVLEAHIKLRNKILKKAPISSWPQSKFFIMAVKVRIVLLYPNQMSNILHTLHFSELSNFAEGHNFVTKKSL